MSRAGVTQFPAIHQCPKRGETPVRLSLRSATGQHRVDDDRKNNEQGPVRAPAKNVSVLFIKQKHNTAPCLFYDATILANFNFRATCRHSVGAASSDYRQSSARYKRAKESSNTMVNIRFMIRLPGLNRSLGVFASPSPS